MAFISYAVINDYGDRALSGPIAFSAKTQEEAEEWAESENFHSASIVWIVGAVREIIRGYESDE